MLADEECVLHVAGRMVCGKVHLGEYVQVVLYLGTVRQYKTHTAEDVNNLVSDNSQRMTCTQLDRVGCACQVHAFAVAFLCGTLFAQLIDTLRSQVFQLVNLHANRLLLLSRDGAEVIHQQGNLALFAQVFQSQQLHLFSVLGTQCLYFFQKFVYLIKYHNQLLCMKFDAKV